MSRLLILQILTLVLVFTPACATTTYYSDQKEWGSENLGLIKLKDNIAALRQVFRKSTEENKVDKNQSASGQTRPSLNAGTFKLAADFHFDRPIDQTFYDPDTSQYLLWTKGVGIQIIDATTLKLKNEISFSSEDDLITVGRGTLVSYSRKTNILRFFNTKDFKEFKAMLGPMEDTIQAIAIDPALGRELLLFQNQNKSGLAFGLMNLEDFSLSKIQGSPGFLQYESRNDHYFGQAKANNGLRYVHIRNDQYKGAIISIPPNREKVLAVVNHSYWDNTMGENGIAFGRDRIEHTFYGLGKIFRYDNEIDHTLNLTNQAGNYRLDLAFTKESSESWADFRVPITVEFSEPFGTWVLLRKLINFRVPGKESGDFEDSFNDRDFFSDLVTSLQISVNDHENLLLLQTERTLSFYHLKWPEYHQDFPKDTLIVLSPPPYPLRPGERLDLKIQTLSGNSRLQYKVILGPENLAVDGSGRVTWKKPANGNGLEQVIIRINNSGGGEAYYVFKI